MASPRVFVSVEDRDRLAVVLDQLLDGGDRVILERNGEEVAALISATELHRIEELLEDLQDIAAAREAEDEMRTTGASPIPYEQVRRELGLAD